MKVIEYTDILIPLDGVFIHGGITEIESATCNMIVKMSLMGTAQNIWQIVQFPLFKEVFSFKVYWQKCNT